jgi:hypothetical protein
MICCSDLDGSSGGNGCDSSDRRCEKCGIIRSFVDKLEVGGRDELKKVVRLIGMNAVWTFLSGT